MNGTSIIQLNKQSLTNYLILGTALVYMVNFLYQANWVYISLSIMCAFVFIFSLREAKTLPRYFSIAMVTFGVVINIGKGNGIEYTIDGLTTNLPLLSLVILVPLISIPLRAGGYFESICYFLKRTIDNKSRIFLILTTVIFFIGPMLNVGVIRIVNDTIKDLKLSSVLLSKVYVVGFSTIILWSPYFASVALIIGELNIPIQDYIFIGLSFAILQLIIGNLLFKIQKSEILMMPLDQKNSLSIDFLHQKNLYKLIGIIILLTLTIFIVRFLTEWSMLYIVTLVSVIFPICSLILSKEPSKQLSLVKSYSNNITHQLSNEIVLFISAGVFSEALKETYFINIVKQFLFQVSSLSFMLVVVIIMVVMIGCILLGIHPIVIASALVVSVDPLAMGVNPGILALAFMMSWTIGVLISPISPINLMISQTINVKPLNIGIKWNGAYLSMMFITGLLFIYILNELH